MKSLAERMFLKTHFTVIRILQNGAHPEKIFESRQFGVLEMMKGGDVFRFVIHAAARAVLHGLELVQHIEQVLVKIKTLFIYPAAIKNRAGRVDIQNMI